MEIRVLGLLELRCGGSSLALGTHKQKTVLALLLARLNRAVSIDVLIDELWEDEPPASAVANARLYVNNLARLLAAQPDAPTVVRHGSGYTLAVDEQSVDLFCYREAVRRGRGAVACGDFTAAVSAFDEGLGLWRGRPVEDVRAGPVLAAWRIAVEEERLSTVEDRAEALLGLGAYDRVVPQVRELLALAPLRERAHALLVRALYQADDAAGALVAFEAARRCLAEQLGMDPGAELRRLHKAILDREPVSTHRAPAKPRPTGAVPRQLPAGVAGFAGRADSLRKLDALLSGHASTVLISAIAGTGGVGKTALAVHWAHRVRHRFPDGQLYVNLRGFDATGSSMAPAEVVRRFLDTLGVPAQRLPSDVDAQAAMYRSLLADKRMLVVLDNARDADQIRPLLPGAPGCLVVVTSRNRLTSLIAAEGAHPLPLDVLTVDEARDLLTHRLGGARVAAEPHAVDELVTLCARLPLALAIVAATAATRPHLRLAALADQLRHSHGRLDALSTGDAPTTDLRAVFSWSYQALTPETARLFRLLGLHPGPDISAPAAASLAALPVDQARRLLNELAAANLIQEHIPGRYTFHDLLRAYATEQAAAIDSDTQRHAAIHRTLDHYLHTAYAADRLLNPARETIPLTPPQPGVTPEASPDHEQALAWFTVEHAVLLAAVDHAAATGFDTHTWQLAWTLYDFLHRRGHWHDHAATQRAALAAAGPLADPTAQARAHRYLAHAYTQLGRLDDAHTELRHALDLTTGAGDPAERARIRLDLGHLRRWQGRTAEALDHSRQALDLFRAAGHRRSQGYTLNSVGWHHALLGDYEQALTCCQQALTLLEEFDDRLGQAATWDSLGYAHHHLGHHTQALTCYQHALNLNRDLGDRYSEAEVLTHLGDTQHTTGDPHAARTAWQQALEILDQLDHPDALHVRTKLAALDPPPDGDYLANGVSGTVF
jgi:DNA-binding SARP family transcriptional activator/Tfp pilus assembly protein PilF